MRATLTLILASCLLLAATAAAQDSSSSQPPTTLPEAPKPQSAYHPKPSDSYFYNVGVFCGVGGTTSSISTKPTTGCGVGITFVPLPIFLEAGLMGPQANRNNLIAYISVDGSIPLAPPSSTYLPIAIAGYSYLFKTGHAFDYGLALALPRFPKHQDDSNSLRIEVRDYWTFANPAQHNVMLRIGWMSELND